MIEGRRLGVLGGAFDPIHYGHLDAAAAAREALALDAVLLLPAHDPPHKAGGLPGNAFHRFALAALAIQDQPGCSLSDVELVREGTSYTADTLRGLHTDGWRPAQIFFILGADAFAEIATWREYPQLFDLAHFVVIARPGTTLDQALARTPALRPRARTANGHVPPATPAIHLVAARTRDVSSTGIRARLARREPIDDLVPPAVARYIQVHHLYGAVDELHG